MGGASVHSTISGNAPQRGRASEQHERQAHAAIDGLARIALGTPPASANRRNRRWPRPFPTRARALDPSRTSVTPMASIISYAWLARKVR